MEVATESLAPPTSSLRDTDEAKPTRTRRSLTMMSQDAATGGAYAGASTGSSTYPRRLEGGRLLDQPGHVPLPPLSRPSVDLVGPWGTIADEL